MLSVRSYKALILCGLALMVLTPTASSIFLLIQNQKLRIDLSTVHSESEDMITVAASEFTPATVPKYDISNTSSPAVQPVHEVQPDLMVQPDQSAQSDHMDQSAQSDQPARINKPGYQESCPEFKADLTGFDTTLDDKKVVYLTFDDGPSIETCGILNILAEHEVKATFFVNNKVNGNLTASLKKIAEAGHTIGMHGASHRYDYIYGSIENFISDFNRNFQYIKSVTGISPAILRFPGGSINAYNFQNHQQIIAEILRRGFVYYDWNVSGADTSPGATSESISETVITSILARNNSSVVLLHDSGKTITKNALSPMIEFLKSHGYTFKLLDNSIVPTNFAYQY